MNIETSGTAFSTLLLQLRRWAPPRLQAACRHLLLLGAVLTLVSGCQSTGQTGTLPPSGKVTSNTLASGDVIQITFPAAAELNQSQKIRIDGKITLPIVGEVTAAGKAPLALQNELIAKYGPNLQDAKVIVSLVSSASVVYVNGAVGAPNKVVLDRQMTVFEAIMESGGFSPVADLKKVTLTRQVDGKLQRQILNLKEGSDGTMYVKPFDTISVGQTWF